jgi:release factor glutamine methyltransferase
MPPTIGETVNALTARFADAGLDSPRLDARILTAHVLGTDTAKLFVNSAEPFPADRLAPLHQVRDRHLAHEPVSRILGVREFWGLTFELTGATLDPRPDTETLVEQALRLRHPGHAARILDLGTGTGCILLSILSGWPEATGVGVDLAPVAVATASRNAERLGLSARAQFQQGSWADGVAGPFDVIVSNPPYISDTEMATLSPEVRDFDPELALRAGDDGLAAYRAIAPQLKPLLAPDGTVLLEVGMGQAESVAEILAAHELPRAAFYRDLAGIARVVAAALSTPEKVLKS